MIDHEDEFEETFLDEEQILALFMVDLARVLRKHPHAVRILQRAVRVPSSARRPS